MQTIAPSVPFPVFKSEGEPGIVTRPMDSAFSAKFLGSSLWKIYRRLRKFICAAEIEGKLSLQIEKVNSTLSVKTITGMDIFCHSKDNPLCTSGL